MRIIKYVTFSSSEEFENWQRENQKIMVTKIMPIPDTIDGSEKCNELTLNMEIAIMVIYHEEE